MKTFFRKQPDKPPAEAAAAAANPKYKIWIPPSTAEPVRSSKPSRPSDNGEARPKPAADADKAARRTAAQPSAPPPPASAKLHKSQSATPASGPISLSAAAMYAQSHKPPKHSSSAPAHFLSAASSSTQHAPPTGPTAEPSLPPRSHSFATPLPSTQYASLPSKQLRHTAHSRSRTIPNTAQPEFWIPPSSDPSPSTSKPQKDRNGHSRSRTDPSTATVNPQIWHPEPPKKPREKEKPPEQVEFLVPVAKSHRSHKDSASIRPPDRSDKEKTRSRTKEERDREREREREKRRDDSDAEKVARNDSDVEKSRAKSDRHKDKDDDKQRERRHAERASTRHDPDRVKPDRAPRASSSRPLDRHPEERERDRLPSSRELREGKLRAVPGIPRSHDDYESSDSAKPKPGESSSRHRRHRTEESITKDPKPYPSGTVSSVYEPPIRPLSSPLLANVQGPGIDYQIIMVDSDSGKSKKEKQRLRSGQESAHSTTLSRPPDLGMSSSSRSDPRQVIGTPGSIERFAVPVQSSSTSSREVTPRREDNSSLESHRHDKYQSSYKEVPTRSFSSSSALPPVAGPGPGSTPQNATQPGASPGINKHSPGKRSLQEKVNYEYGVIPGTETITPPGALQSQVSPALQHPSTSKSSPPKRDAGPGPIQHRRSNEASTNHVERLTPIEPPSAVVPPPSENTYEVRSAFTTLQANPDIASRPSMSNYASGNSIPRSSTSMAFRRDEPQKPAPPPPSASATNHWTSFSSQAAAGASLQRPSTSTGFSSHPGPQSAPAHIDIARAAFLDQQRDRLVGAQAPAANRTPFPPPSRSGAATPFPMPNVQPDRDRPRADSSSSMKGAGAGTPLLPQPVPDIIPRSQSTVPPPIIRSQSTAPQMSASGIPPYQPSQTQYPRDNGARSVSAGAATPIPIPDSRWDTSSGHPLAATIPPRDTTTPKPYRHPILTELLTSPTNNTKYASAAQKPSSAPWDYETRQHPQSAQEAPPEVSTSASASAYAQYQHARRAEAQTPMEPMTRTGSGTAFQSTTENSGRMYNPAIAPPAAPTRHDVDMASMNAHRAGAMTPAVDSTRQRNVSMSAPPVPVPTSSSNPPPPSRPPPSAYDSRAGAATPALDPTRQRNISAPPASTPTPTPHPQPPSRPSPFAYDSYASRTTSSSNPNFNPTVSTSSSSQAVHRPNANPSHTVSDPIPPHTHVAPVPTPIASAIRPSTAPSQSQSKPSSSSYLDPTPMARSSSHDSIMKTPSSLAPSVLKKVPSRASVAGSVGSQSQSQSQETKKKGFLRIFRSRTSSQPTPAVAAPPIPTPAPAPTPASVQTQNQTPKEERAPGTTRRMRAHIPSPISVPAPDAPAPPATQSQTQTQHGGNGTSAFSPFRYLSAKRHRTVSGASLEAVSGTANNTVVGSPTASLLSSAPPPPPLRDPVVAAREWSHTEAGALRTVKHKVRRPGVTFELKEDPPEDKPKLRHRKRQQS